MKATFLGHQGWMLESSDARLLIDPIITPYYRNSAYTKMWMYPPREIDLAAMGSVDAIYLSHEHEDHFHIESLHLFSRDTKLYVSGNISGAAVRILEEMGFLVRRLYALEQVEIGEHMTMTVYPPPASPTEHWVLQPFVLEDEDYRRSFFNPVDCQISDQFIAMLDKERVAELGLVCVANNTQNIPALVHPNQYLPGRRRTAMNLRPANVLHSHLELGNLPFMREIAIVGCGFISEDNPFGLYLNQSQAELGAVMEKYSVGAVRIFGPQPGEAVDLRGDGATRIPAPQDGFVRPSTEGEAVLAWAEQTNYVPDPFTYEYDPVSTKLLHAEEQERLGAALDAFAIRMAGHRFQIEMTQSNLDDHGNPVGAGRLLLILMYEDGNGERRKLYYEYRPADTRFYALEKQGITEFDLAHRYPFGYECWAKDLLGLLEGDVTVYEIINFRNRFWHPQRHMVERAHFPLVLNDLFAPECIPELTYQIYRRAYDRARASSEARPV